MSGEKGHQVCTCETAEAPCCEMSSGMSFVCVVEGLEWSRGFLPRETLTLILTLSLTLTLTLALSLSLPLSLSLSLSLSRLPIPLPIPIPMQGRRLRVWCLGERSGSGLSLLQSLGCRSVAATVTMLACNPIRCQARPA